MSIIQYGGAINCGRPTADYDVDDEVHCTSISVPGSRSTSFYTLVLNQVSLKCP